MEATTRNCWFLATLICLTKHEEICKQVIPLGQSFETHVGFSSNQWPYGGIFWFRFWRFGDWYDVLIDDFLPTKDDQLVLMQSENHDEFWPPLLEKAYAKLLGSYGQLEGGHAAEAMQDLTGGLTETVYIWKLNSDKLFHRMLEAQNHNSLQVLTTKLDVGSLQTVGLWPAHSYAVLSVEQVYNNGVPCNLVHLRNTTKTSWTGRWSIHCPSWNSIPKTEKDRIQFKADENGEFWISCEDCCAYFELLEICHLRPTNELCDYGFPWNRLKVTMEKGEWVRANTAGGSPEHTFTFYKNPHFQFVVKEKCFHEDDDTKNEKREVFIALMQNTSRTNRYAIGYNIHQVSSESGPLTKQFFDANSPLQGTMFAYKLREVFGRHKLAPGTYIITPYTSEPDQEAKFLIRIFGEDSYGAHFVDI